MESVPTTHTIPDELDGERLDKALGALLGGAGRRRVARLWETHDVRLDGRTAGKGGRVHAGQLVTLTQLDVGSGSGSEAGSEELAAAVRVIAADETWCALSKPAGLHTARIAGRAGMSLEALLPELPGLAHPGEWLLVNRLDRLTSGIVLAARGDETVRRFREQEDAGKVRKTYLAVVRGAVEAPLDIRNGLNTAKRRVTRVLDVPDLSPLRHTQVAPVRPMENVKEDEPATLVTAAIKKGARHQIRAHLAHAGHPILFDPVYGEWSDQRVAATLLLHHAKVALPGFEATCAPEWRSPYRVEATDLKKV